MAFPTLVSNVTSVYVGQGYGSPRELIRPPAGKIWIVYVSIKGTNTFPYFGLPTPNATSLISDFWSVTGGWVKLTLSNSVYLQAANASTYCILDVAYSGIEINA